MQTNPAPPDMIERRHLAWQSFNSETEGRQLTFVVAAQPARITLGLWGAGMRTVAYMSLGEARAVARELLAACDAEDDAHLKRLADNVEAVRATLVEAIESGFGDLPDIDHTAIRSEHP